MRQLFSRSVLRRDQLPEAGEDLPVQFADEAGDDLDAHAILVQHPHEAFDLPRRGPELGQVGGLGRLQRDQVRMAGHERHQLELAEDADHRLALAHHHAVDAVPQHQQHGVEEFVIDRYRPGVEGRDLAHGKFRRRFRPQQGVAQVAGGEDADALAVADERVAEAAFRKRAAEGDEIGGAVDEERLAHVGVADPRRHQGHDLAAFPRHGLGPPRRGRAGFAGGVA